MNRYDFDEEEASDDELKSVMFTAVSSFVIVVGVILWIVFA